MHEKLVEFSGLLRKNGLRVSLTESMDAFRALSVVGLGEREIVRATLRTSMVKRTADVATFEQLFDLFFSGLAETIAELTHATADAIDLSDAEFQRFLEDLQKMLEQQGNEMSELARALLGADGGTLERL